MRSRVPTGIKGRLAFLQWQCGILGLSTPTSSHQTILPTERKTVIAYLDKVLDGLPDHVKKVSLWSDGPASQVKNRYIAASLDTLQCKHKLEIQWNFFATSHGKGPVDWIGGSVKHHVWGKVRARKSNYVRCCYIRCCS